MRELYNFFIFILLGIVVAFIYDIFRIMRKTFKTSNIITYIEDILFWLISGFFIITSIFYFNEGEIRFYLFIGIFVGILIYIMIFTKLINNILSKLLFPIKKIIDFLIIHFKKIYNKLMKFLKKCKNKSKKAIQKQNFNV